MQLPSWLIKGSVSLTVVIQIIYLIHYYIYICLLYYTYIHVYSMLSIIFQTWLSSYQSS